MVVGQRGRSSRRPKTPPLRLGTGQFRMDIPWRYVVSDNVYHQRGKRAGREYKAALQNLRALALSEYETPGSPISGTCVAVLRFYFPDRRKRDMTNAAKIIFDALKGRVIDDDDWKTLYAVGFEVGGVDTQDPRVELTIAPYCPGTDD